MVKLAFEVDGLKETIDALDKIELDINKKKVLDRALSKASAPITKEAKQIADALALTGNLAKGIKTKVAKIYKPEATASAVAPGSYAPHSHWAEYGTALRWNNPWDGDKYAWAQAIDFKRGRKHFTGQMPPLFSFYAIAEKHEPSVVGSVTKHVENETNKAVKKYLGN